jgi:CIC family chloride channel protein
MIAGLAIGLLALQIPDILGVGDQVMRDMLDSGSNSALDISILLLAKISAAALCLGFGFVGGVFSPSLLIGMLLGSLFGLGIEQLFPYANIPMYAICGMAAVTSPVIGAPLTTILIVFELTHSYDLTTAVMVSVVFSNVVSYRLFGRSLFDFQLKSRGYDLSHGRDPLILNTLEISSISHPDFLSFTLGLSAEEAIKQLIKARANKAFVLDLEQRFVGNISLSDLLKLTRNLGPSTTLDAAVDTHGLRLSPNTSVWAAMHEVKDFVGEAVPIVDDQSEAMLGIIYETDLIAAYMQTTRELRNEETANA